jgi:NAD(P)H-dependent FMN reductase
MLEGGVCQLSDLLLVMDTYGSARSRYVGIDDILADHAETFVKHGQITAAFKNQIDWIPLSTGSVRPTQGRTLAIAQVNGGSQSFNTVNSLRILGRWMRMFVIPNQSSVPTAWKAFTGTSDAEAAEIGSGRMKASSNRDRVVDVCEELVKFTCLMRGKDALFSDRFSERKERMEHGKLLTQAEKDSMAQQDKQRKVSSAAFIVLHIGNWQRTDAYRSQNDILASLGIERK